MSEMSGKSKSLFRENVFNIENIRIAMVTRDGAATAGVLSRSAYSPLHTHSNYEFLYTGDESAQIFICDKKIITNGGELIIISPNVMHRIETNSVNSIGLQINIASNGLEGTNDFYGIISNIIKDDYVITSNCHEIGQIISYIDEKEECGDLLSVGVLFYELFVKLIRVTNSVPDTSDNRDSNSDSMRKYKIQTLIHHNFSRDISIEEIADALYLSPRQASRVIKEYFGCTFKDLVVKMRMDKAEELICRGDLNINEIARSVGYYSIRGFYSAFKNRYGCLPGEYKKNS